MRLLAVDFDNTLFNGKDYYKNIKYINRWIEAGNIFVIVTGRYIESLLKDINTTGLKYSYLICDHGGIIFDQNLKIIYQRDISKSIVTEIATILEQSNCINDWYISDGIKLTKDKNSNANSIFGLYNDRYEANELFKLISHKYNEINGYFGRTSLNIINKDVNKGASIKILTSILKITDKDVYTIGDEVNDISMSDYNFNNYCMTNSSLELKRKTRRAYNSVYELIMDIEKEDSN